MNGNIDLWKTIRQIRTSDNRFAEDAYLYVMRSLERTVARLEVRRHISAAELLSGIVEYTRRTYGLLGYSVLESWGIRTTADIGAIVFHLVNTGVLAKRDGDAIEDFDDVFDLEEALEQDYLA
jgi:uncharacterized repeat protein (TIGR04138 family)